MVIINHHVVAIRELSDCKTMIHAPVEATCLYDIHRILGKICATHIPKEYHW